MLMIYIILGLVGLCLGSFVNALVWRLRQQEMIEEKKSKKKVKSSKKELSASDLSILKGRSMCPDCHRTLSAKDLIPVLSWVILKGRCRYCHKKIAVQYPLVELVMAGLFVLSALAWPDLNQGVNLFSLAVWLICLTGFMALIVYDIKWQLLPNRIVYPLLVIAGLSVVAQVTLFNQPIGLLRDSSLGFLVGGGIFCLLFYISDGKWIGGGDVKLGGLLGILAGTPVLAFLVLFLASVLGTLVIIPGMLMKKINAKSHIPFGPFLIIAGFIAVFYGQSLVDWYVLTFLTI